jgi:hypothetical protein
MKLFDVQFINLVFVINNEIMALKFLMFPTCYLYLHSSTRLHGLTSQKTVMIIIFVMRTSSFRSILFIHKLSVGPIKLHCVKVCGGVEVQLYIFLNFSLHGSAMLHVPPL